MAKRSENWATSGQTDTFRSEADLSSSKYCIVVRGTSRNQCNLPSAAGEGCIIGVIANTPESGTDKDTLVVTDGRAKVKVCGTVSAGDELEIGNSSGHAQKYTGTYTAGHGRLGYAEESGVTNDVITATIEIIDMTQLLLSP